MTNQGPQHESAATPLTSFDMLTGLMEQHQDELMPYSTAKYIRYVYDHPETVHPEISDEQRAEWREMFPRPDDTTISALEEERQEVRLRLSQELGLESPDQINDLTEAWRRERDRRQLPTRHPDPEGFVQYGISGGNAKDLSIVAHGALTLARLTGDSIKVHPGDIRRPYYLVGPETSEEEVTQLLDSIVWVDERESAGEAI